MAPGRQTGTASAGTCYTAGLTNKLQASTIPEGRHGIFTTLGQQPDDLGRHPGLAGMDASPVRAILRELALKDTA